jgi:hypothetical protein
VLFVLGLSERLAELADPSQDRIGLQLDEERLPKRIRTSGTNSVSRWRQQAVRLARHGNWAFRTPMHIS